MTIQDITHVRILSQTLMPQTVAIPLVAGHVHVRRDIEGESWRKINTFVKVHMKFYCLFRDNYTGCTHTSHISLNIVDIMVGNFVLRRRVSGALKPHPRPKIITSNNITFQYNFPHYN